MNRLFKLDKHSTNVKTEVIAGLTTFLAMAYILAVNPGILSQTGMSQHGVFFATAFSAGIASILMGVLANYPVALAPGMGVNAFFTYTICLKYGFSYQAALAAVFVSGFIFLLISVTGVRQTIINTIPKSLKNAIGAGIGFFVAFIGFRNAGLIVSDQATFVSLGNLKDPAVLLSLFGLVITIIMLLKKINGAVFFGLVITSIVGVLLNQAGVISSFASLPQMPSSPISFNLDLSLVGTFASGFSELFTHHDFIVIIFSFLFVDFFDTAGTLIAIGNRLGIVNEKGEMKNIERALLADAVGTVVGAGLGTSTVTSFVESGSGVAAGGKTGLTAVTTGVCFFLALLFSPLLAVITANVTAPALIIVGVLMSQQLAQITWQDLTVGLPAFFTVITMVLTYSISDGIALGFLTYTLTNLVTGDWRKIKPLIYILDIIFIVYFII